MQLHEITRTSSKNLFLYSRVYCFLFGLLVGGPVYPPLWKIWVNWDDWQIPNISGKIKLMATKPPSSLAMIAMWCGPIDGFFHMGCAPVRDGNSWLHPRDDLTSINKPSENPDFVPSFYPLPPKNKNTTFHAVFTPKKQKQNGFFRDRNRSKSPGAMGARPGLVVFLSRISSRRSPVCSQAPWRSRWARCRSTGASSGRRQRCGRARNSNWPRNKRMGVPPPVVNGW